MIIAKCGNFLLTHKTYLNDVAPTTHNIEIRKQTHAGNQFTIADFDDEGQIRSCLDRLLTDIENEEDLDNVRYLAHLAWLIICRTEKVSSNTSSITTSSEVKHEASKIYHTNIIDIDYLVHEGFHRNRNDAIEWVINFVTDDCMKRAKEMDSTFDTVLKHYIGMTIPEFRTVLETEGFIEEVACIEEVNLD